MAKRQIEKEYERCITAWLKRSIAERFKGQKEVYVSVLEDAGRRLPGKYSFLDAIADWRQNGRYACGGSKVPTFIQSRVKKITGKVEEHVEVLDEPTRRAIAYSVARKMYKPLARYMKKQLQLAVKDHIKWLNDNRDLDRR